MYTNIKTITTQFECKTLPREQWTHKAHIAVAFNQIIKYKNVEKALHKLRHGIKAYNISMGIDNTENSGYHETLTVFWLKVVYAFCASKKHSPIDEIYNAFIKTMYASAQFPTNFYSKDLLFSKSARQTWTEPDLLPIAYIKEIISNNIEQHFILTDQAFEEQFEKASLDPTLFTHEAHIRLAWIHILKYGETKAIQNITRQLHNYVRQLGMSSKYNEILTIAAIKAVNYFMQKKSIATFYEFITIYPTLKHNFKNIIEQHYGFEIFNIEPAKEIFRT